jgi:hypothetical protein
MFGKKKKKDIESINNHNFIPHYNSGRVDNGINQYQYNPNFNSQNANANLNNQYNPNVNMNPGNNPNFNNQYNANQYGYANNQNNPNGYYNNPPQPQVPPRGYEQQNNFNPQSGYSNPQSNRVPEPEQDPLSNNAYQSNPTFPNDNYSNQQRPSEAQSFSNQPLNNNQPNDLVSNGENSPLRESKEKAGLFHKNKHSEPLPQQPVGNMNFIAPKKERGKPLYLRVYKIVLVLILLCLIAYIAIVILKTAGIIA